MFSSELAETLQRLHRNFERTNSFFCFRRKQLSKATESSLNEVDRAVLDIGEECSVLRKTKEKQVTLLEEQERQNMQLSTAYENLSQRFSLLAKLLAAEPRRNEGLEKFHQLLNGPFMDFANRESSLAEEAQAVLDLLSIERDLQTVVAFPEIYGKNVIAIGGGYSSGKSALANSFFQKSTTRLPVGLEPVTAIPTYIVSRESHFVFGLTHNGGAVELSQEVCAKLSHDYVRNFGVNLRDIMPYMAIETSMDQELFEHVCLIDTPGYNPAQTGTTCGDRVSASARLKHANALIWAVGLDTNGTIPQSDINFLNELDLQGKQLYVVGNKADLRDQEALEEVVNTIRDVLDDEDINCCGVSAYSANLSQEYYYIGQPFYDFLKQHNKAAPSQNELLLRVDKVLSRYLDAINKDIVQREGVISELNSMRLDLLESGVESKFQGTEDVDNNCLHGRIETLKKLVDCKIHRALIEELDKLRQELTNAVKEIFIELKSTSRN